jgi:hypothetical protein
MRESGILGVKASAKGSACVNATRRAAMDLFFSFRSTSIRDDCVQGC